MSGIDLSQQFNITCPAQIEPSDPILVIDDQQDLRLIVVHHLAKLQFKKVHQASTGLEALEVLRTQKIKAIVCAMDMPNMTGLDLLSELREEMSLDRVPFCLTMGNVNKGKIMLGIEHGVDEILVRPFTLGDILPKIKKAFKVFHNPKNPEKVYELAKRYVRDENYEEATKVYSALHQAAPKTARPLVGLARLELLKGNEEPCFAYLKQAEENNPNYVHIYTIRGDLFAKRKAFDEALVQYSKGIKMSPLNPMRYISAVKVLMDLKKYEETAELLNKAIQSNVTFPELYNYLSQAYFQLKDFKMAIKSIRHALAVDPSNIHFINQLGIAYKESQQPEEAIKCYNKIIKLQPGNIAALYNKAVLFMEQGQLADAFKSLERILQKEPENKHAQAKIKECEKLAEEQKKSVNKTNSEGAA